MKFFLYSIIGVFCALVGTSSAVNAAELYVFTNNEPATIGKVFDVDVRLHSENESINAVENILYYPERLQFVRTNLQNSFISFWIHGPVEIKSAVPGFMAISMSGLVPGGIAVAGSSVASFDFVLPTSTKETSPLLFTISQVRVLLNDGKGTAANIKIKNATIPVLKHGPELSTPAVFEKTNDQDPPEPFAIAIAQNPNLFNNRWFAAFNAPDLGSGIDHYEFQENKSATPETSKWVIADNPVELVDQKLNSYIFVRATDRSGNQRTVTIAPKKNKVKSSYSNITIGCILLLVIFVLLVRLFVLNNEKKYS